MKRFAAIVLVVLMVAAMLVSCGDVGSAEGKYVIKSIGGQSVEDAMKASLGEYGEGLDIDAILEMVGLDNLEDYMNFELKADGTVKASVAGEGESEGTWKQDGNKVTITIDDEPIEFDFNGSELSAKIDDQEYVLVKK